MNVEEALRARMGSSSLLLTHADAFSSADTIMFPGGRNDAIQLGLQISQSPLYAWSNQIKRIVSESLEEYPLTESIGAMHYFHQPAMFWLFDDVVFEMDYHGDKAGIDAILVLPWKRGPTPSKQDLVQRMTQYIDGSAATREALRSEVMTQSTGVYIYGCHSMRSGIPIQLPGNVGPAIPVGARICLPVITTTIEFGQSVGEQDIVDHQLNDPTIYDEMNTLKRWVLAGSALLKQRILVAERADTTRQERKRLTAEGLTGSVMTVVLRSTTHGQTTSSESAVEWSHRWVVRGHWRDQWYPSQQEHRIIWVPPYIKGPDDMPLIVRPEIYAVNR